MEKKNSIMILFFYWSFFVLDFFSSISIWSCFVYILNMVLILLIVVFFPFLCFFFPFNFVTQHFISLLFFSRFSPYFFNCSFLILFLIFFSFNFILRYSISFFFNPILVLSFFITFSYFMYRLSSLLFSFISFYTRFGHHYFDYYLFSF
jgi:hypothetical protein